MADVRKEFRLTGWHVLAGFVAAFGLIIAVNVALAVNAVRTFPGLETRNSYIASQTFDVRRAAQQALGWNISATHDGGLLVLKIVDNKGVPVQAAKMEVILGRPTHQKADRVPQFRWDGTAYVAREELAKGNWDLWINATAMDGTPFEQRLEMYQP